MNPCTCNHPGCPANVADALLAEARRIAPDAVAGQPVGSIHTFSSAALGITLHASRSYYAADEWSWVAGISARGTSPETALAALRVMAANVAGGAA
jgi:hypothetical protein